MGFSVYYTPDPTDLYEVLEKVGPTKFIAIKKLEAMAGHSTSIAMLELTDKLVKRATPDKEILEELYKMLK